MIEIKRSYLNNHVPSPILSTIPIKQALHLLQNLILHFLQLFIPGNKIKPKTQSKLKKTKFEIPLSLFVFESRS